MCIRKTKICLIIDHPLRDLEGMILLAHKLVHKNFEVYLTPMYHQSWDVFQIKPDIVIVNYLRNNNKHIVKAFSDVGIVVGVLDTEGGVFNNMENDFTFPVKRSSPENIDFYCLWGEIQKQSFIDNKVLPVKKIFVTGCPRYDFCSEKWRGSLVKHKKRKKRILIATRFSMIFPRFNKDFKSEIDVFLGLGKDNKFVLALARKNFLIWSEMVNLIAFLADKFQEDYDFVLRPHPFEKANMYQELLKDKKNVQIIREGSSLEWINSCDLLIQKDCSTAIEAWFLDKPVLSIDWVDAEEMSISLINNVVTKCSTKEEMVSFIEEMNLNKKQDNNNNEIKQYFFENDGNACERVVGVIEQYVNVSKQSRKAFNMKVFLRLIKSGIIKMLGLKIFFKIKKFLTNRPIGLSKFFSKEDIGNVLKRISLITGNENLKVTDKRFCFSKKITMVSKKKGLKC